MIYKYTDKRAKDLHRVMANIPQRHKEKRIIFAYGVGTFKFILKDRTIEVSRYDEEIIIRKIK